jgi:hypothetical protein
MIKTYELVYILPDGFVIGVKYMRPVGMQVNTFCKGAINVAAGMAALVYNQAFETALPGLMGKYASKQAGAYYEVIVWGLMVWRHKL